MAGTHAHKSPSGAERFHGCSGALAIIGSLPPEQQPKSGPAAQLGTAAHGLLEKCLTEGKAPETFRDRIIVLIGDDEKFSMLRPRAKAPGPGSDVWFIVDDDMIDGVTIAYDYVVQRCEELEVPLSSLTLEGRTNPLPDRDDTAGTADITIDDWPTLLEVVDYKNGRWLVEHEGNPQLLAYLTGRAEDTNWSHDRYRITVVQPNAYHEDGRVRSIEVSQKELRAFQDKHRRACERADEAEDAMRNAGGPFERWQREWLSAGDHCTMCPAEAICKVREEYLSREAAVQFAAEPLTPEDAKLDVETAKRVAANADALRSYITACEKFVAIEVGAGRITDGFKTVQRVTHRIWNPDLGLTPEQIAKSMVEDGFITDNKRALLFTEPSLITGPQAEKLVPKKMRAAFSRKYLHKPTGEYVVVPESDPRPAAKRDAAADFADHPVE